MSTTYDVRLEAPATVVIAGPTGSGKTRLLQNLVNNAGEVAKEKPKEIVYCYSVWQETFKNFKNTRFVRGLVDVTEEFKDAKTNKWLIIDDLMDEVTKDDKISNLFTKYSHHLNVTVFLVVQNLFVKKLRTVSVNGQYFFLGKNPRDPSTIMNFAKQVEPGNTAYFMEAYKKATKKPYSFLLVNMRQETPEEVRLIGEFGSGEAMVAYRKA